MISLHIGLHALISKSPFTTDIYIYIYIYQQIVVVVRFLTAGIKQLYFWVQSQVVSKPKTLKMVLDTSLLNTQQYKVHIKGKVE